MTHFAPRKGIFALILLASFCLHILLLVFSSEKAQYDTRLAKGNQILSQLSGEVQMAMASQDKVSLSVIANRYQNDKDIAKLAITDANNATLVQTGQAQTQTGQVLDKTLSQDNQLLGHLTIMMKEVSKGEIISSYWPFLLGSAIIHGLLWLIYGLLARPTAEQLQRIGEKVQQRLALTRSHGLPTTLANSQKPLPTEPTNPLTTKANTSDTEKSKRDITDFLQAGLQNSTAATTTPPALEEAKEHNAPTSDSKPDTAVANTGLPSDELGQTLQLQLRFFDEFDLLNKIAPEVALPYFKLCEQLFSHTADLLFTPTSSAMYRQISSVRVVNATQLNHAGDSHFSSHFSSKGATVTLTGKAEQLPLAAVLLSKLFIILNQVVYEKHRELSRFALPMRVGICDTSKAEEMQKLLNNHAKADSILLLLSTEALKLLRGQVQLKNQIHPTTLYEREMAWYSGMSEYLITQLIEKRNQILALA